MFMVHVPWVTFGGPVADAVERAAGEAFAQLANVSAGIDTRPRGFRTPGLDQAAIGTVVDTQGDQQPRWHPGGISGRAVIKSITTQVKFRECDSL